MSLRARLMLVTVGLVAAGLLVADVATYRALSSSLLRRVDEQLVQAQPYAIDAIRRGGGGEPMPGMGGEPFGQLGPPAGTYVALLDGSGNAVFSETLNCRQPCDAPMPSLPSDLPGSSTNGAGTIRFTSGAQDGSTRFRVRATPIQVGGTLVIAIPLTELTNTVRRLFAIEAFVSIAVLALAAALASWFVRAGLRPLEDMGETAGAIAAGDLSRRVEPADGTSEVGRLGAALNAMLAQIEAAFDERRASEARLRRFVADASHELRTPITSIRGYAELFRRGADTRPEDLATSMSRIEAEAERMGVLVDDLLLLARLDQGRPLAREPVDVVTLAREAIDAARAIDPGRTITLDTPVHAVVTGDAGRLRQVLDNLIENARVHTLAGTQTTITVRQMPDAVSLSVADDGPGMNADVAARAFERFYRGDPARARSTGGAGLGLSIVAAIVEAHGGAVRVTDAPGTEIEVALPLAPPDVEGP
jgi:two-component system, OmpR family, sensor kinase